LIVPTRAVIFDLDDTLTDGLGMFPRIVATTARMLCEYVPSLVEDEVAAAYLRESPIVWKRGSEHTGVWLRFECWRRALVCCDVHDEDLAKKASAHYSRQWELHQCLTQEAINVLQTLRCRYRTGLITNGPVDMQQQKIDQFELHKLMDYPLCAQSFGPEKPAPEVFWHVAEKLGVASVDCIVVGDSLRADIAGAHNAGMRAIWIDHKVTTPTEEDPKPEFTIHKLGDVLEILRQEGNGHEDLRNTVRPV
jgi:putative hydrolase of the HAD superfamily